jgi:hypothetical protein
MTDTTRTCSRAGCDKTLRRTNTTGRCATGCRSSEAPAAAQAIGVRGGAARKAVAAPKESTEGVALERFRAVCAALSIDADQELEVFAQAWLDGLRQKLTEGGES